MAKKTTQTKPKSSQPKSKIGERQSKILKNLATKLSDDYHPDSVNSESEIDSKKYQEIQKINKIISSSVKNISSKSKADKNKKENNLGKSSPSPSRFDGVSSSKESRALFKEQIKHLERENTKLKYKLELLHDDFQKEKTNLKKSVRELKKELHRTAPLTGSKIFSFSKELKEVIDSVESFSSSDSNTVEPKNDNLDLDDIDLISPSVAVESPLSKSQEKEQTSKSKKTINQKEVSKKKSKKIIDKNSKKKKTTIASATLAAILIIGISSAAINHQPEIDKDIVDSYLNQDGEVQGSSDEVSDQTPPTPSLIIKEQKNNEVSYDKTQWEVYRDEFLGFQVKYPDNVTDTLYTGNTITFLRKDGYLFKIQRVSTDKSLKDYWESIKDDSLKHESEPVTLRFFDGLHLALSEEVEFPGNKYLVKAKDHIFDIWYATPSDHFDDDDMKRVDYMVESLRFL